MRHKLGSSWRLRIANRLVPIQNGSTVGIGVVVVVKMGPVTFPHNEIRNTVAVDIRAGGSVSLRKGHTSCILSPKIIHDQMSDKGDLSLGVPLLLKPR